VIRAKHLPFYIMVSIALSACGSSNSSPDGSSSGADSGNHSLAVGADGMCSSAVLSDFDDINSAGKKFISSVGEDLNDLMNPAKKQDALRRQEAKQNEYTAKLESFKAKYGDFTCNYSSYGGTRTLNPAPIYKAIDDIKTAREVKPGPIGKDGNCTAAFTADFNAMKKQAQVHLQTMMGAMSRMLANLNSGASNTQNLATIKDSATKALGITQDFRTQHPGTYACNITNEDGGKSVVSSDQMDEQLANLRAQLAKM